MKECKCEVKKDADYNPLNLIGGDTIERFGGLYDGEVYIVTTNLGNLRLVGLEDGTFWNPSCFMGEFYNESDKERGWKKVNICFKREN